jgi:hypothetical protein
MVGVKDVLLALLAFHVVYRMYSDRHSIIGCSSSEQLSVASLKELAPDNTRPAERRIKSASVSLTLN